MRDGKLSETTGSHLCSIIIHLLKWKGALARMTQIFACDTADHVPMLEKEIYQRSSLLYGRIGDSTDESKLLAFYQLRDISFWNTNQRFLVPFSFLGSRESMRHCEQVD